VPTWKPVTCSAGSRLDSHFARGVEPEKAARLTAWPAPLRRRGFTDSDSVIAAHRLDVDADSLQPVNCPVAVLHGRESVIDAESYRRMTRTLDPEQCSRVWNQWSPHYLRRSPRTNGKP